jgi:ABC-2 type transport system ATP-binding protein
MPLDSNLAIDLRGVTKLYKRGVLALDGIEMHVKRGEIFGLLGPNGAGKSTLVKIIMSVTRPTRAEGSVLGHPVGSKASLLRAGYLPEHHRFPRYLTGRQTLEFFAALSNVDKPMRKKRAAELLETVGMTQWADAKVSTYSKGMMQRVGVAQALVNDPELVILDEPTDGVDPVGRKEIRDVLLRLRDEGRTVFVNSHLLQELEIICNRVAILKAGQVVSQGTIDELTRDSLYFSVEIESGDAAAEKLKAALGARQPVAWTERKGDGGVLTFAGKLADGLEVTVEGPCVRIKTRQAAEVQSVIDAVRAAGLVIRRIQPVRQSLEELFMETVGGVEGGHQAGASIGKKGGYRP